MTETSSECNTFAIDKNFFHKQIVKLQTPVIEQFDFVVRSYVLFHVVSILLAFIELVALGILFPTYTHTSLFSIVLSLFFLTMFSFLILRLFFSSRKSEQLFDLSEQYILACREIINYREGTPDHHLCMTSATYKLIHLFEGKETKLYPPPYFLDMFTQSIEKLSCFLHWEDTFRFKEHLYQSAIEEHLKLIKCEPTSLEYHAALANAFVMLSTHYSSPLQHEYPEEYGWVFFSSFQDELEEKFKLSAEKAMEEFRILNEYAPDDPWIHMQLAYSYRDLQMPQEEIQEYETLIKLCPDDIDSLYKLGSLYFQTGNNAKGLRIYQSLKAKDFQKAEHLIGLYGQSRLDLYD